MGAWKGNGAEVKIIVKTEKKVKIVTLIKDYVSLGFTLRTTPRTLLTKIIRVVLQITAAKNKHRLSF